MIYLPGATSAITVNSLASVLLSTIAIQAPGSHISLPSAGNITIASTGFYQVTFGVMPTATSITTPYSFHLAINGSAATPPSTLELIQPATEQNMYSMTTIIQVTTNPTTLTLVNGAAASATINNATATTGGAPAAYVTIMQIR
jgi:hypothetical protein